MCYVHNRIYLHFNSVLFQHLCIGYRIKVLLNVGSNLSDYQAGEMLVLLRVANEIRTVL